jgi:transposase
MLFETRGLRVFIYTSAIDMRSGFERLHFFVREHLKQRVDQGHVYLFFGKNRRRLKVLYFDGSGLVLVSKRIERGNFMSITELSETNEISVSDLRLIFHGSVVRRPVLERSILPVTRRERVDLPAGKLSTLDHASRGTLIR